MDRSTAAALVTGTFRDAFEKDRFVRFVAELCNGFDAGNTAGMPVPPAFEQHIQSCERLGTFASADGEYADILVVCLPSASKLERARTALRDFVANVLKREANYKEAALVAFVASDSESWRFSFVRMEYETKRDPVTGRIKPEERLTPARRYSYLVGPDEQCHTAQARFLNLLQDATTKPTLSKIEEAFSVEAVTKEFFEEYVRLFTSLEAEFGNLVANDAALKSEFTNKRISTVDFAKKLLGQIVFLYFLQKKGWLGVPGGEKWGTGPHDFMRRLANRVLEQDGNLFDDALEPLFYDTLATDRGHEAWCGRFESRIPFLNGGLFEPLSGYDWRSTSIPLPNSLFTNSEIGRCGDIGTGILDVFDRYNFTVNEAEPLEKDVAVDPEMLGKVFENLIEENRRKGLGAYYTPRDVVHYMCQASLIQYLERAITEDGVSIEPNDVEQFIREGEQASHYEAARTEGAVTYHRHLPEAVETHARALDQALASITVCDPAIGSGAFPVGMMTEIVRARMALTPYFNDVEERTPYHFKRHAIQTSLYGVDIDSSAVEIAKLRLWLSLVVDEEDVQQIKPLPNLDYKVVVGDSLGAVEKNLFNNEKFTELEALKPRFFDDSDPETKAGRRQRIDQLIHELTNGKSTFDFETYFSEVFHVRAGFDVVIANPPYVSVEKFARTELQESWKKRFKTYAARGDIYCLFYERGMELLNANGTLTFISSNKFQRAGYGKRLRSLLGAHQLLTIIDFCELPVFDAATDPTIVITSKASSRPEDEFPVLVVKEEGEIASLWASLESRASVFTPDKLKVDGWSLEGGDTLELVEKIRRGGEPLLRHVGGQGLLRHQDRPE